MEAVGVAEPARCVFVGDRLFDDIWGAERVGMRTIHIPHSEIPVEQLGHTEGRPGRGGPPAVRDLRHRLRLAAATALDRWSPLRVRSRLGQPLAARWRRGRRPRLPPSVSSRTAASVSAVIAQRRCPPTELATSWA